MNKSKKILLLIMVLSLLSACAEKDQYQQAILAQLKDDQDIKDYKIDPERMADCVVDMTSRKMPGFFTADPERKKAYLAYTKMLTLTKSKSPEQVMEELRAEFGSAQELSNAHSNYTDSILNCQTGLIAQNEEIPEAAADDVLESKSGAATAETPATITPEQPVAPVGSSTSAPIDNSVAVVPPPKAQTK